MIPRKRNVLSQIRDVFWNYPSSIFEEGGAVYSILAFYKSFRPFSHIFVLTIFFIILSFVGYSYSFALFNVQTDTLIEGVIIGDGTVSRINPLIPSNNQLETDLASLIYHPLVRVDASGEVRPVLAESWGKNDEEGKEYFFNLRKDVYWHDGETFTADDVLATFDVLKALGAEEESSLVSKHAESVQLMEITKIDNYKVLFKLEEINPTFFEDVSCGILPKHILDEVSLSTFSWARFNLRPIGTGPFVWDMWKDDVITLVANPRYFLGSPRIAELKIVMYETGDDAVEALKSGNIHILADPSTAILKDLKNQANIEEVKSAVLYRRYWALYFNLKEGGPSVFSDLRVRQAVSLAIDREAIVSQIETAGEEALGPIPKISWAYNADASRFRYDPQEAVRLLEEAGWEKKEVGGKVVRIKGEEILRFELAYLDKYDRRVAAESVKTDLEKLGIIVNLDPRSSSDLNEALIATRNFDMVLYGVETPIDPDRIRLWHSNAIEYPGLNISSYQSGKTGAVISTEKEIERITLVDAALENARTSLDQDRRRGTVGMSAGYLKFQEILLEECPAVFLYHPVFAYAVHTRVKGIDLSEMTVPEDRYLSILNWRIEE
jgi:peptide/nickel transport system substrate-binding protein